MSDDFSKIKQYFKDKERQLLCYYESTKEQDHTTCLGNNREYIVKDYLQNVLPERLGVVQGCELIDHQNNRSGQIDILIKRDDTFTVHHGINNTYPIESAHSIIEVKTKLNKEEFKKSINGFHKIENLKSTSKVIFTSGNSYSKLRPYKVIIAFDGVDNLETIDSWIKELKPDLSSLFIYILGKGAYFVKNELRSVRKNDGIILDKNFSVNNEYISLLSLADLLSADLNNFLNEHSDTSIYFRNELSKIPSTDLKIYE